MTYCNDCYQSATNNLGGTYREVQAAVKYIRSKGHDTPKLNSTHACLATYLDEVIEDYNAATKPKTIKQGCQNWTEFKAYLLAILVGSYYTPLGFEVVI